MGLKYVVAKQVFGFDQTRTAKFVQKQVITGQVSFNKLCTQVGQICGAHRGTVQLVIAGLVMHLLIIWKTARVLSSASSELFALSSKQK